MYLNKYQLYKLGQIYAALNVFLQDGELHDGMVTYMHHRWKDPYPLSDGMPYKYFQLTLRKIHNKTLPEKLDQAISKFLNSIDPEDHERLMNGVCPMEDRHSFTLGLSHYYKLIWDNPIQIARRDRRLRRSDLAEMIGVNQEDIEKWENGTVKPDDENFEKLAEALKRSVDYLLKGEN